MKIPPVYSSTDIRKVRKLYDAIEQNCRGLQALGVTSSSYGAMLVPVLLQKLPEDIKLELTRKLEKPSTDETTSDDQWDLDHLLELLKGEVEARELCGSLQSSGISQDSKRSIYIKNTPSTASALFSAGNKKSHASCTFCHGAHTTAECQVVTSLPERRNIFRKQGRCFLCLKRGSHLAKDCDADIKCFVCKRRHHVALCEQKYENLKPKVDAQPQKSVTPVEKTTSDTDSATSNCNCRYVNSKNTSEKHTVLLQTAVATIKNPGDPEITGNARIIFDSGSQR